ncbi:Exonuclease RNase T and DNA polymerase III [Thauera sp. 27]|uniref:3'-5' exonuclease n=1 Tax=Thauera sp. 27 TaxID=305700 RepID=UPI0002CDCCCE|nr:3'-5' exonuclease [Thauera sp. 27]ENO74751.1 Exonuclease RNase T and DNA polymerase III [Thauera sp. 27]
MADPAVREASSRQARAWLEVNALVLDTETTGLGDDAEVVELAVIDCAGVVLLDTLVRPSGPVPAEAGAIHGITDAMLADAPTWSEIHARFCGLVEGRQVVIYSREFDTRVITQTARRYGLPAPQGFDLVLDPGRIHCAMQAYAEFRGEWSAEKGRYRWQKLSAAAQQQGVTVTNAHRALGDCLMTLGLVRAMASPGNAQGV